jgi:hypothetical protein
MRVLKGSEQRPKNQSLENDTFLRHGRFELPREILLILKAKGLSRNFQREGANFLIDYD